MLLPPQGRDKIEGHQIAPNRDELTFALLGKAHYRDKGVEALHIVTRSQEWVFGRFAFEARTVNDWFYTVLPQAFAQALNGCLGAAPLSRIEFSEQVYDIHNQ